MIKGISLDIGGDGYVRCQDPRSQQEPRLDKTSEVTLLSEYYLWTKLIPCLAVPDVTISHLICTSFLPMTARFIFQNSFAF